MKAAVYYGPGDIRAEERPEPVPTQDNLVAEVAGVDLLAIESTYTEEEREVAATFGHLTASQGAWLAREAGAKHLVLHHISRRYSSQQMLAEATSIFPETSVARDFDLFRVVKQKPVEREDIRQRPVPESAAML